MMYFVPTVIMPPKKTEYVLEEYVTIPQWLSEYLNLSTRKHASVSSVRQRLSTERRNYLAEKERTGTSVRWEGTG